MPRQHSIVIELVELDAGILPGDSRSTRVEKLCNAVEQAQKLVLPLITKYKQADPQLDIELKGTIFPVLVVKAKESVINKLIVDLNQSPFVKRVINNNLDLHLVT